MTRTLDDSPPDNYQEISNFSSSKRGLLLPNCTATAYARPTIQHSQLRHLITCPQRRGIVYYVSGKSIDEKDLLHPHLPPRKVISLDFEPTCFAATASTSNPHAIVFAAGGQYSQLHVSLHAFPPTITTATPPLPESNSTPPASSIPLPPKLLWKHDGMRHGEPREIVNTIMFTPTSLTDDTRRSGSSDLRMIVGGNNKAVRVYDIILQPNTKDNHRMQLCGHVTLETCVNHVSISPNGRTLLCVGDTSKVYLYYLCPGTNITFFPIATYDLPRPAPCPPASTLSPTVPPSNFRSIACFSSAWSPDGLKFAVGSQEGQLCVWDVRSAWPIFQYWTPYRVNHKWKESHWETTIGSHMSALEENGPDSGIRSVKFTGSESGRELLLWVEQTVNLHVIDARTFDLATHAIIPFPDLSHLIPPQDFALPSSPSPSLIELSPSSSTDSLVEGNSSSRTTTETATTTNVTNTTTTALSRQAEVGSTVRLLTRTPSPNPPATPVSRVVAPTSPGPQGSASALSQQNFENDAWWPVSRSPPTIFHILRTPSDIQRRRERLQRQRILEQFQREGSGAFAPPQQQQQQQQVQQQQQQPQSQTRPDSSNNTSESTGNPSSINLVARRDRVEALLAEAHRTDRGVFLRSMQSLASTREEISAEIRSLIDDTRARIAALNGNNTRGGGAGGAGELPHPLRSLAEELEEEIVMNSTTSGNGNGGGLDGPVQISGLCFDPTGGWVYVAGSTGIAEWRVREREEGKGGASGGWM